MRSVRKKHELIYFAIFLFLFQDGVVARVVVELAAPVAIGLSVLKGMRQFSSFHAVVLGCIAIIASSRDPAKIKNSVIMLIAIDMVTLGLSLGTWAYISF